MLDNLKGELRVFVKEPQSEGAKYRFSTCIASKKNEDGEYSNYYVFVNWSKPVKKEIAKVYKDEYFDILVEDAWLVPYKTNDERYGISLFVNKARVILNEDQKPAKTTKAKPAKKTSKKVEENSEDDVPF